MISILITNAPNVVGTVIQIFVGTVEYEWLFRKVYYFVSLITISKLYNFKQNNSLEVTET